MKSAVVAIEPTIEANKNFAIFCEVLNLLQKKGIIPQASIATVIHSGLFMMPQAWYQQEKNKYAKKAQKNIENSCRDQFQFDQVHVIKSDSSQNEYLVGQLSRYVKRRGSGLLIVSSSERRGLPYWFLGSFAETASLAASVPVMVIKPIVSKSDFSKDVRFVVGVDVAAQPSQKALNWLASHARLCSACVDLVYVESKPKRLINFFQEQKKHTEVTHILERLSRELKGKGIRTEISILKESHSIAHSLVEFSEKRKAWLTITFEAKRSLHRRLLLGSSARRTLSLTKRPFLSLRLEA